MILWSQVSVVSRYRNVVVKTWVPKTQIEMQLDAVLKVSLFYYLLLTRTNFIYSDIFLYPKTTYLPTKILFLNYFGF